MQKAPRPQIYIYELPAEYRACKIWSEHTEPGKGYEAFNYGTEKRLPEVLRNSSYWTSDPEEADLFYMDAWFYCLYAEQTLKLGKKTYDHHDITLAVLSYVRQQWPYWDRSGGVDHIWLYTYDHGFCGFSHAEGAVAEVAHSIILSHWGLEDPEDGCSLEERVAEFGCPARKAGTAGQPPCFVLGKDTVIASTAADASELPAPAQMVPEKRLTKFFFAGDLRTDDLSYSHGVRQTVHALFVAQPGFKVVDTATSGPVNDYAGQFGRSTFCLASTGAGWGVRLKMSLTYGCIPVIVADRVQMPYEDVLPYKDFAVRVPQHAIYRLPDLLDSLLADPAKVRAMQARMACVSRFFTWRQDRGLAFEALLCSLRRKIVGQDQLLPKLDWASCELHCEPA
ncbi:hypothetical protein WJX72_003779 [[Myrmecia] bisecta]|uniref:Exostosin GT47 domain-containing protein n=1 Tax=[Myrmecia] bisecta TaxID=41462 RepID=A0AAW1QEQ0_9CHLO